MPNGVKYSITQPTGGILKSNVALGVYGNLGPTGTDSYEYLLKDGITKSGKYVYNPYKVNPDPNKTFSLKGDKRIQLFIDQYDQIIDLYNQDKDKFLSALKDETIRLITISNIITLIDAALKI